MKLRTKLMAAPAFACAALFLSLMGFTWVLSDYRDHTRAARDLDEQTQTAISSIHQRILDAHVTLYRTATIISSLNDQQIKDARSKLQDSAVVTEKMLLSSLSDKDQSSDSFKQFTQGLKAYAKAADDAIDLASVDPNTGIAALQSADAIHKQLVGNLGVLIADIQKRVEEDLSSVEDRGRIALWGIVLGSLLAGGAALTFAWLNQRRIVTEIQRASDAADEVALGHLDRVLSARDNDEVGHLMDALGRMVHELSGSINTVKQAAQSIGTASIEIASGNQDLSQRTENTASSLQETASSMVQLTTTVRNTADAARSADSLASNAADSARRGGSVMEQVVANMSEIDVASRKINEIIGVIDGIAFQTNILALNAAVEAARAGEQGRGFAVVAGEVRSLAQRSAQAAREIKNLIGASTERVEVGARLVGEAGASMRDIVSGVERVTQIISEITRAAEQESNGIGQVNIAVGELDQMTQQNAALVEQSAAAAESLKHQAQTLSDVVSRFKLASDGGRPHELSGLP